MDEALQLIKVQQELIDELKDTVRLLKDLRELDKTIISHLENENKNLKNDFDHVVSQTKLITGQSNNINLN